MRTRNNVILFRLDDKEHAYLKKQVKLSGLSMASYLRAIIKGYEVRPAPTEETIKLLKMLFGMSNNLNQLTMLAHIHGSVSAADIKKIEEFLSYFWDVVDAVRDCKSLKEVDIQFGEDVLHYSHQGI